MALADGSAEFQLQEVGGRGNALNNEAGMQVATATYTSDTAETGTINMIRLPAGSVRVHSSMCRLSTGAAYVTNSNLSIGYAAYTQESGTAVAADDDALVNDADAGGGALDVNFELPGDPRFMDFNSQEGITITATVSTANISVGSTLNLEVVFSRIG